MRCSHHPVGQVFDHFVSELDFRAEGQIVTTLHYHFGQLAKLGFYVNGMDGHVQVTNVSHNGQHHVLDAGHAEMLGYGNVLFLVFALATVQHRFHNVNGVFDELGIGVRNIDLEKQH